MEETSIEETKYHTSGLANLPNQVHYLASRHGIRLNLLLFGEAALGKTQMINGILGNGPLFSQASASQVSGSLRVRRRELDDQGTRVTLSLVDIPQLGQAQRKADIADEVVEYVRAQHIAYLQAESRADRLHILPSAASNPANTGEDSRIHSCLYFLNPNQHCLSRVDLDLLHRLSALTNVIGC